MPFRPEYLPLATGCVEQTVQAYGMGRGEAMHLALAVEEVYSFLANRTTPGQRLRLSCRFAGYYAEVVCRFQRGALPVEAFNITATVSSDDEKSLDEMGLLLAARTVDQLRISAEDSEMGVRAAATAGMAVIQVPDLVPASELTRSLAQVVTSLHETRPLLRFHLM